MALTSLLLLLFVIFRRSEQWMRQHIIKVGWLLTHNRNTAIVFYYSAFLPGVVLHEGCRWLVARLLKARVARSLQLPQADELQFSLAPISPDVRPLKRLIIEAAPVMAALAALWLIATEFLDLQSTLRGAAGGGIADLDSAIGSLLAQPDFGLWFYLMFAIANTMLPPFSPALQNRQRIIALVFLMGAFAIGLGSNSDSMASLATTARGMISSLIIILFTTSIINFVMALALGTIEAIIEAATGHSATFADGIMLTETRQQAQSGQEERQRAASARRDIDAAAKAEKQIRSIYALPLPIPGPPGIEPVSKPVAAVLNVAPEKKSNNKVAPAHQPEPQLAGDSLISKLSKRRKSNARPKKMPQTIETGETGEIIEKIETIETIESAALDAARGRAREQPAAAPPAAAARPHSLPEDLELSPSQPAPFSRPFRAPADDFEHFEDIEDFEDSQRAQQRQPSDLGFARPFAPEQVSSTVGNKAADNAPKQSQNEGRASSPKAESVPPKPKIRPVPKPSQRPGNEDNSDEVAGELRYEPLDDNEYYEAFDDDLS